MKHVSWMLQKWCEAERKIDERNVKLCQMPLQRTHRMIESWLKCTHDSVRPNVVTEIVLLYIETCMSNDTINNKPAGSNSDFSKFLLEYTKQSILVAYLKVKQHYDATSILRDLSLELPTKTQVSKEIIKASKAARMKVVSKKQEWIDYIEEIEMLFDDEAEISIALWRKGIFEVIPEVGMETLAVELVTDIKDLLSQDSKSLDVQYRVLLAGASRFQMFLQTLCHRYMLLEQEKNAKQQPSSSDVKTEHATTSAGTRIGPHLRRESFNEMFGNNTLGGRLRKLGEFADNQRIDKIFEFIQTELSTRLQSWMEKSLHRCRDFISRAAEKERWECDAINAMEEIENKQMQLAQQKLKNKPSKTADDENDKGNQTAEEDVIEDEDRGQTEDVTWANFVGDSFLVIDNEINAYFVNLKSFAAEAMSTSTLFYERLGFVLDHVLKIIQSSFIDITILDNSIPKEEKKNIIPMPEGQVSKVHKHVERVYMARATENFVKTIDALSADSQVDQVLSPRTNNDNSVIPNLIAQLSKANPDSPHENHPIFAIANHTKLLNEDMGEVQMLDDEHFKKELKYMCIKLSTISRLDELIADLGPRLLRYINSLEEPKEAHLKEKFEKYRNQLIQSTHKFVTDSKALTNAALPRASFAIARRFFDVQIQHYFAFELYAYGNTLQTTVLKLGLLAKMKEYLEICDKYLRYKDLRMLTCAWANLYGQRMQSVLIGPFLRTFEIAHNTAIVQDFEESFNLFQNFNEDDFDKPVWPVTQKEHPLFGYHEVIKMMKMPTAELIQLHVLIMAERAEEEEKSELEKEKKEELEMKEQTKGRKYPNKQELMELYPLSYMAEKGEQDKERLKKIHDHPSLHVLAHRKDEEAQAYVENFMQFRDKQQPLVFIFTSVINPGSVCDPFAVVTVNDITKSTRVVRQSADPSWQQVLDFDLTETLPTIKSRFVFGNFQLKFEIFDWTPENLPENEAVGYHQLKIKTNQKNISYELVQLYQDQKNRLFAAKRGQLLISVLLDDLWLAVNELVLTE
ncbi:hypothetical protein RFI_11388 [Reticulomyxa filosa]|uniref:C2 domain-containing protein n=1 Tax=Reticulomyxa filosa TaxID=46433 RepID=X6NK60_RETFI|nr:hypothetical protein RFI_11388 [Reticulomyxa filosa]|eukprot:ETO25747.1 hypothetical protein RFI_11388 [Reticulomyxa filosa]